MCKEVNIDTIVMAVFIVSILLPRLGEPFSGSVVDCLSNEWYPRYGI